MEKQVKEYNFPPVLFLYGKCFILEKFLNCLFKLIMPDASFFHDLDARNIECHLKVDRGTAQRKNIRGKRDPKGVAVHDRFATGRISAPQKCIRKQSRNNPHV